MVPHSAKAILDYIGKHEAPRGYDDYRRTASRPPEPLTKMTIREVQHWQSYANPGRDTAAAGKYQIIEKTFDGLVREMGLRGDEKFSPNLQDQMALRLLKRRGFDKFIAGNMSAEDFCNSLAKEWASMPMVSGPKRGKSYYGGDGLNAALTKADEFLHVVKSAAPQSTPAPPEKPDLKPEVIAASSGAIAVGSSVALTDYWWIALIVVAVAVVLFFNRHMIKEKLK